MSQLEQNGGYLDVLNKSMVGPADRGVDSQSFGRVFTVILFVMFIVLLLLAIMAGTLVYKNLSTMSSVANDSRVALSLLANSVRGVDAAGAVGVGVGPEGNALVLTETFPSGTFETRIYLYKGQVMQEYAVTGAEYTPERATPVVASKTFGFEYADGLLSLTTDHGTAEVALRTLRGGE